MCVVADLARGAFQEAQLVAQQNEPLRPIEDAQGEFGMAEDPGDGAARPLDLFGDRSDGTRLGRARHSPSRSSRDPGLEIGPVAPNGKPAAATDASRAGAADEWPLSKSTGG